jgi:soluble lytic murein transglycosylase-like protein
MSYANQPDEDFQKILDSTVKNSRNPDSVSRGEINDLISKYSEKNGLDEDFVKAVINQESGFNPNATSSCGAMGLMQLMPSTAQGLGVTNAYDAEQNIEGGTKYLKGLMDRFGNDKSLALAAYNAGPNAVKKYGGIPPYAETQNYIKSVLGKYDKMKGAI